MLRTQILILLIFIQVSLFCQERNIKGTIKDFYSKAPIEGVKITHSYSDTVIYSNEKGEFMFDRKPVHNDTLKLTHQNYFSNLKIIGWKKNLHNNKIRMFPLLKNSDSSKYYQENLYKLIIGKVFDRNSGFPLPNATIKISNDILFLSDSNGKFSGLIPDTTKYYYVSHPEFESVKVSKRKSKGQIIRQNFELKKTIFNDDNTPWLTYKNLIGIAVNEFANGAIGFRYQYFFKPNHAIGIHNSYYFDGRGISFFTTANKYTGIKMAPYYRIYSNRKLRNGAYLEGKLITGYFDFNKIWYSLSYDSRYGASYQENFWSYGLGFGGGYYVFFSRSNHFVFNVYAGIQYLPMMVPNKKFNDNYGELNVSRGGWYFFGPGSAFEIKLIFSSIF